MGFANWFKSVFSHSYNKQSEDTLSERENKEWERKIEKHTPLINKEPILKKEGKRELKNGWEIRKALGDVGECKKNQSYTERLLLKAMNQLGLSPEEQYNISFMNVDFAFPQEKVIIEVEGPQHKEDDQRLTDIRRGYVLRDYGWSIWRISAEKVYTNPIKMAYRVKFILERKRNG